MNGSHRLYLRQKKVREIDAEAELLFRLEVRLLVHGEEYAGFEPVLLVEQQRRRPDEDRIAAARDDLEAVVQPRAVCSPTASTKKRRSGFG